MTRAYLAGIIRAPETPKEIKVQIYTKYIRPVFLYAAPAWRSYLRKEIIQKLEVNERKIIRSIFTLRHNTKSEDEYRISGLKTIMVVIDQQILEYNRAALKGKSAEICRLVKDNADVNQQQRS